MIYVFYRVRGTESSILMYLCGGNIKRIKAHSVKWPHAAVRRVWVRVCMCVCVTRMWRHFQLLKIQRLYILLSCVLSFFFLGKNFSALQYIYFKAPRRREREEKKGRKKGAERGVCRQQKLLIAQTHTHTHTRVLGPISTHTQKAKGRQSAAMATHKTS